MSSYLALIRSNRNFRLLWAGQTVSQLGDWFNTVAVYALLLELTGSATAVAWMMVAHLLPIAVMGPVAGVVVDRMNRRTLMIVTDLLRGVLMLGLLFIERPDQVWIAYFVTAASVTATAFFEPARTASIPKITSPDELLPANALSSATWSAMLAIGAAVGGLVTALVGRDAAFIVNSASFFASAYFILRTRFDGQPPPREVPHGSKGSASGLADVMESLRYLRSEPRVANLLFVKMGWGMAGGVLLLLTIFGERVFPVGANAAAGIGILYGARGVGAGLGPVMGRWLVGQSPRDLRRSIGPSFFLIGVFYIVLAGMPNIWLGALCVLGAHFGGSILWVFSTVLLQIDVPDRFRGRIFAADLALTTLISAGSSYLTAWALDSAGWSPREASVALGVAFCMPGLIWLALESRCPKPPDKPTGRIEAPVSAEEELLEGQLG